MMCKDEVIIDDPIIPVDQATTVSLPIPRDIEPRDGKALENTGRFKLLLNSKTIVITMRIKET